MNGRTFVDTNVLVYLHEQGEPLKQKIAGEILNELWYEKAGIVSVQVLQEFYVTVTKKIEKPLTNQAAREVVNLYARWCLETSASIIVAAFRIEDEAKISFWDALIVASAEAGGAVRLLTEDMNHGQVIAGVRIENPFA